jgi:hypothetical protein
MEKYPIWSFGNFVVRKKRYIKHIMIWWSMDLFDSIATSSFVPQAQRENSYHAPSK